MVKIKSRHFEKFKITDTTNSRTIFQLLGNSHLFSIIYEYS